MKIQNIVPVFLVTTLLLAGCKAPVKVSEVKLPEVVPVAVEEVVETGEGLAEGVAETVEAGIETVSEIIEGGEIAPAPGVTPEGEVLSYDGEYTLVAEETVLGWSGKKIGGGYEGVIDVESGSIDIVNGVGNGSFIIDMTSMRIPSNLNAGVMKHLKNEDFFDVEVHPTASLELKDVDVVTGGAVEVVADLTIKGITNEIRFPATVSEEGDKYVVSADFSIDRTRWDIRYGSGKFFSDLGDKAIDDEIGMSLSLVLEMQ